MSSQRYEVPSLSILQIRNYVEKFLDHIGCKRPFIPIVEICEFILPQIMPDFTFLVCNKNEMGKNMGLTCPEQKIMQIREDIYEGACRNQGMERFTIAHELGHLLLHNNIAFARTFTANNSIPAYRDSEWQANCFAGELLISHKHIGGCKSLLEVPSYFGVSAQAAEHMWKRYMKEKDTIPASV